MQALNCDAQCGMPGQVVITIIETGNTMSLCWDDAITWGEGVKQARDEIQLAQQFVEDGQEPEQALENARRQLAQPAPRKATRRRSGGRRPAAPSELGADGETAVDARSGDSVEHRPPVGTDIGGHHTDNVGTKE